MGKVFRSMTLWVILIALLGAFLLFGFVVAWPEVTDGMFGEGKGFLLNLLSEGSGIVVSTIVIAPLTAYFVERRRQRELAPARAMFVKNLAKRLLYLAETHRVGFGTVGSAAALLGTVGSTSRSALQLRLGTLRGGGHAGGDPVAPSQTVETAASALSQAITDLRSIQSNIASIERLVEIHSPFIPPSGTVHLNGMLQTLHESLHEYWKLEQYVSGTLPRDKRPTKWGAALDMPKLVEQAQKALDAIGDTIGVRADRRLKGAYDDATKALASAREWALAADKEREAIKALLESVEDLFHRDEIALFNEAAHALETPSDDLEPKA